LKLLIEDTGTMPWTGHIWLEFIYYMKRHARDVVLPDCPRVSNRGPNCQDSSGVRQMSIGLHRCWLSNYSRYP